MFFTKFEFTSIIIASMKLAYGTAEWGLNKANFLFNIFSLLFLKKIPKQVNEIQDFPDKAESRDKNGKSAAPTQFWWKNRNKTSSEIPIT